MSIRYVSNLFYGLLAGFIVVASQAFAAPTVGWLAFGAGVAFAIVGAERLVRGRGAVERTLNAAVSTLGILMILEGLLAGATAVIWLSFAGALGVLGLAVVGLTVHELTAERVVHSLEAPVEESRRQSPVAA